MIADLRNKKLESLTVYHLVNYEYNPFKARAKYLENPDDIQIKDKLDKNDYIIIRGYDIFPESDEIVEKFRIRKSF